MFLLAGAFALVAGAVWAAAAGYGMRLRADPDRVPADGKSPIVVLAEVVDALGRPAPDGTVVHFSTTLGTVTSPVQTIGGLAQTVVTAPTVAGTALVSAIVAGSRQSVQIEFLAEPGSASPGARLIELEADEVAYSADKRVFVATWQADLKCQAMEIRADGIQYDMGLNVVCAQGDVTLCAGGRTLTADALRYELLTMRGQLVRLSDPPERLVVEGGKLETRPDKSEDPLWEPFRTGDTRTWVKARRAVISPGEKIILDHATFYVNDTRVMSLRRHVLDPRSGGAVFGQALAFNSASGVMLDLPMYYRASANHLGSLHLTRNRSLGGDQIGTGWSLGLREEYTRTGHTDGAFELDDVLHPDRGMRWEHRTQLGGGLNMSTEASTLRFDQDSPALRSKSVSFFRPLGAGRLSLLLSNSDFGTSAQSLDGLDYRFPGRRVKGALWVTPALYLRHSSLRTETQQVILDPDTGEPLEITEENAGRATISGLDLNFSLPARDLGHRLRLNAGLTTGYARNLAGGGGGSFDGRLMLDRRFGTDSFLGLGLTYSGIGPVARTSLFRPSRGLLSLAGESTLLRSRVRMNVSRSLDGERGFGSVGLTRPLPFGTDQLGHPLWDLDLSTIFSHLDEYRASNTRLALGRLIGHYELALCWSPQGVSYLSGRPWVSPYGYGYTYSGGRHLWIEFASR